MTAPSTSVQRCNRWRGPAAGALAAAALIVMLTGCGVRHALRSPGGALSVRSRAQPQRFLKGDFDTAIYAFDDKNDVTIVLLDGTVEAPRQAVTIRLLWKPRVGRTPIDSNATNATIHYVIFTGNDGDAAHAKLPGPDVELPGAGEAGVYNGAGFLFPETNPGGGKLTASVWQSTLRLADRSAAFTDLLGQSYLEGRFTARRNDAAVSELLRQLDVTLRARLGYPRMVDAGDGLRRNR